MSAPLQKSSERAVASFDSFIVERTARVQVKVFLCGKALATNVSIQEQVDVDLRAYLLTRLEGEIGCEVFLGEHNRLIQTYHKATGYELPPDGKLDTANLSLFEGVLAEYADLVVILPDSPGSFAELGMFSVAPQVCPKLLLIIKGQYKGVANFINRGPVIAATNSRAQVEYVDYADRQKVFEVVKTEVIKIRDSIASQGLWQKRVSR